MGIQIGTGVQIGKPFSSAGANDPIGIVTSTNAVMWVVGDNGITIATGVSDWADQTAGGNNFVQATGTAQPSLSASLNGRNVLTFDGTDDLMLNSVLNLPAPGTTNCWIFSVIKCNSWVSGRNFYGTSTTGYCIRSSAASPNFYSANGTQGPDNNGASVGTWVRAQDFYNNSTSDYLKLGSVSVNGTNKGNSNPAATFRIGAGSASGSCLSCSIACMGVWFAEPTAGEKAALDTWVGDYYGISVVV